MPAMRAAPILFLKLGGRSDKRIPVDQLQSIKEANPREQAQVNFPQKSRIIGLELGILN